jgi:hypothetical protein
MYRFFFVGLLLALSTLSANAGNSLSSLTFTKSFGAANIPLNGTTSLTFSLAAGPNIGTGHVGNFVFTDTLPAGLVVATPNGLSGLTPANCLGAQPGVGFTAVAASNQVAVTAARMPFNTTCSFSVNVTGTTLGLKANTVTATGGLGLLSAPTAIANLFVGELSTANVPTLSQWGLLGSMGMLALMALWAFKRRAKPSRLRDL